MVLIEALSRGVPVIATRCDGPECIVNEENGILTPLYDMESLSEALIEMYHQYPKYPKERLRNYCLSLYGKEAFYKNVMAIYHQHTKLEKA